MTSKCLACCAVALLLSASTPLSYQDGRYEAQSSVDEDGAFAWVTITLKDSRIVGCTYETYQKNGLIKDESYARGALEIGNGSFYAKAQPAVAAMQIYQKDLLRSGVDKISGTTIAYDRFTEAVRLALEKAEK